MSFSDFVQLNHQFGAILDESLGQCRFQLWAPNKSQVELLLMDSDRSIAMEKTGQFHYAVVDDIRAGERYAYRLPNGNIRADPASRYQPDGVHESSAVVSRSFDWTDQSWLGLPANQLVIYEVHIGAFSEAGTFLGAITRLDELVDLGVTAIELMPLAESAGRWNWGYDGVDLFAPSHNFGTPDDLRQLIDAAHHKGLAVILDVVYNHLGPEGNYLGEFGPYLSRRHSTTWGSAPNFDHPKYGKAVRQFFIANALHWIDEYHFDGLRVDAIHCMIDESETHIAKELAQHIDQYNSQCDRNVLLIAESNVYDAEMVSPLSDKGLGYDAQWCDDFLHSVFAVVRPDEQLCHRAYQSSTDLHQTLQYGFVYTGSLGTEGRAERQSPNQRVDTSRMIYSIQNHDFIGNHPLGERFAQLTDIETQMAAAGLLLLCPAIPMLFMGEEFACAQPFRFFVDFTDQRLRRAVERGRKREYPQHDWSQGLKPTDPEVFNQSKIGDHRNGNRRLRSWYKALIEVRRNWQDHQLLRDANLTVINDPDTGLYQLQYNSLTAEARVVVRLAPQSAANLKPVSLGVDSGLILDSRQWTEISDESTLQTSAANRLLANQCQIFFRELTS